MLARPDMTNGWITHRDFARQLGVSTATVYRWQKRKDYPREALPYMRRGHRLYSQSALLAAIDYRDKVVPMED